MVLRVAAIAFTCSSKRRKAFRIESVILLGRACRAFSSCLSSSGNFDLTPELMSSATSIRLRRADAKASAVSRGKLDVDSACGAVEEEPPSAALFSVLDCGSFITFAISASNADKKDSEVSSSGVLPCMCSTAGAASRLVFATGVVERSLKSSTISTFEVSEFAVRSLCPNLFQRSTTDLLRLMSKRWMGSGKPVSVSCTGGSSRR
jgi:hypothetical protein